MQEIFSLIEKVALGSSTVIIYGGVNRQRTGGEGHHYIAQGGSALHPFNCGAILKRWWKANFLAIPRALSLERSRRRRFVRRGNGGTLFLDEISTILPLFRSNS